ncbi:MAG TPA: flagellar M-ring protein FliF, partial [Edaphobacter sp.]
MAETEQTAASGLQRVGQGGAVVNAKPPMEKALELAGALRERVMALPPGKKTWLGASALFVAAMLGVLVWYGGRTDWRVLFSGLDGKDVQQVSQELAAAGIPYQ